MNVRFAREDELGRVNELRRQVSELHAAGKPDVFKPGFPREMEDFLLLIWNDPEKHVAHQKAMVKLLQGIDTYYEGKYHEAFADTAAAREADILWTEFNIALKNNDRDELKKEKYGDLLKKYRFRIFLNEKLPWLVRLKHKIIKD